MKLRNISKEALQNLPKNSDILIIGSEFNWGKFHSYDGNGTLVVNRSIEIPEKLIESDLDDLRRYKRDMFNITSDTKVEDSYGSSIVFNPDKVEVYCIEN